LRKPRLILIRLFVVIVLPLLVFVLADAILPLPSPERITSISVLASDGSPLRSFADKQGIWRYPVRLDEVSPLYIEALLNYEDRWFYKHPGINPLALLRAGYQWIRQGRVVSGGSTLTMQVARIIDPHERSIPGKFKQIFRALQLEWHYDKDEILTFYLNLAPYGGSIEGVQTASYAYLQKTAKELSHAEAALLTVLPQLPSRLRPDRHPERARSYRDKVLKRMQIMGVWDQLTVKEAMMEAVESSRLSKPMMAPLFARHLKPVAIKKGLSRLDTQLNIDSQWAIEEILRNRSAGFPEQVSAAVLVMDNQTGFVHAYAGSTDFMSTSRFGQVDMIQAIRSPGSTLKPFLYGMALDEGIVHSQSLLSDVPIRLGGYAPKNFHKTFQGPVSVTDALQLSLNVPAVDLLQRVSPDVFVSRLRNAGLGLFFPRREPPSLAVILGGTGTTLEDLVRAYSSLARKGITIKPRYTADDPVIERQMMTSGASWIIRRILADIPLPDGTANTRQIAWKTGTSYGFRDAWAVGVAEKYTVGIWTGRPDGTPSPGRYGNLSAAPILFEVMQVLPYASNAPSIASRPESVTKENICWPLGIAESRTQKQDCHVSKHAWILNRQIPPTLPNLNRLNWSARLKTYWINAETEKRVSMACADVKRVQKSQASWPTELLPWLSAELYAKNQLPELDQQCSQSIANQQLDVDITSLENGSVISSVHNDAATRPTVELLAQGGSGHYFWLLDGRILGEDRANGGIRHTFKSPGDYNLTVIDDNGGSDRVNLRVLQ
jgi:penicillin-binding protein 1C